MPLTDKEQILQDLSLYPLATLERLKSYADNILIPEDDLLLNVTMVDMIEKAMQLADQKFPEWTDRSASDFGRFLVELFALFSEKDFYYINAFANESFLQNMNVYYDIFVKAIELGYAPTVCTAAQASFSVQFSASTTEYTYGPGTLILQYENRGYKFTNLSPITVPISVVPVSVPVILHEGSLLSETQTFNGSRFNIRQTSIDVSTVRLFMDSHYWTRVRVFGQSDVTSRHFMTIPDELGSVVIVFGKDGYGRTPAIDSSAELTYLKCSGSVVNGVTDTIIVNKQSTARNVVSVTLNGTPTGGLDAETKASVINNALNYFSTKFTVNNATNVERWLNSQDSVKQSKALIQGSFVFFRVQPSDGSVAGTPELTALETAITPYLSGGYMASGVTTTYQTIASIDVQAYYLNGYNADNIVALIKSLISDYTNPLILGKYGKDFVLSEVEFFLKSKIPGLQSVVFVTPNTNVSLDEYKLFNTVPTANITVTTYAV